MSEAPIIIVMIAALIALPAALLFFGIRAPRKR